MLFFSYCFTFYYYYRSLIRAHAVNESGNVAQQGFCWALCGRRKRGRPRSFWEQVMVEEITGLGPDPDDWMDRERCRDALQPDTGNRGHPWNSPPYSKVTFYCRSLIWMVCYNKYQYFETNKNWFIYQYFLPCQLQPFITTATTTIFLCKTICSNIPFPHIGNHIIDLKLVTSE